MVPLCFFFKLNEQIIERAYPPTSQAVVTELEVYFNEAPNEKKYRLHKILVGSQLAFDIIALVGCVVAGSMLAMHVWDLDVSPWFFFGPAIGLALLETLPFIKMCSQSRILVQIK